MPKVMKPNMIKQHKILRNLVLLGAGLMSLPTPSQTSAQSLDGVIQAALSHAPQVAAADARADGAEAKRDLAITQRRPDVNVQGQLGIGRIDPQGFFALPADNVTPRAVQFTADIPLLTFGRIGGAIEQASHGASAARLMAAQTRLNLQVQVTDAYARAMMARQKGHQYTALRDTLLEMVRHAQLKFNVGEGTSTEQAQAKARLAQAQAGIAAAQGQLANAMADLQALSGRDVKLTGSLPPAPDVPKNRQTAIDLAWANNPQLQAAQAMVQSAQGGQKSAHAQALPIIGAYAEASTIRDQFFPGYKADSASAGLRLKWNFMSFGRNSAKKRGANAALNAAQAEYDGARMQTRRAAINAFENLRTARLVLTASEAQSKAAAQALRGTELEIEVGAKPAIALLDARREAIAADTAKIEAQGMVLVSAYQLRAVTGG